MRRGTQIRIGALVSAAIVSLLATAGWSQQQPSIRWLGALQDGLDSYATGVSADGRVVVGWSYNHAFRWENGVMQNLGTLGGYMSKAYGVSADGSVVVGWALNTRGTERAFRWTRDGGMQDLGSMPFGNASVGYGVSADGSVVVGWAEVDSYRFNAFRWTADRGMQVLGSLGLYGSEAYGVSADGNVVVGLSSGRAFRWTAANGMQDLGTLGGSNGWAFGVSADGSVVVGKASYPEWGIAYSRAFRWTASGGMQNLGTLLPLHASSVARATSADGSVVVGWAYNDYEDIRQHLAFRWTERGGMENLNLTYAHLLTNRSILLEATAISSNGRYIVGTGYNAATGRYEGYLLDTVPEPASLLALGAGLTGLLRLRRRTR